MAQLRGALQMKLAELNKITLSYVRVLRHCFLTFLFLYLSQDLVQQNYSLSCTHTKQ